MVDVVHVRVSGSACEGVSGDVVHVRVSGGVIEGVSGAM